MINNDRIRVAVILYVILSCATVILSADPVILIVDICDPDPVICDPDREQP